MVCIVKKQKQNNKKWFTNKKNVKNSLQTKKLICVCTYVHVELCKYVYIRNVYIHKLYTRYRSMVSGQVIT